MAILDGVKNAVTARIAGRLNQSVSKGLKRVAGNLPGTSIGRGGSNNPSSAAMENKTRFTTKNLAYPLNVEGDPMQGHYIMFMINETKKAKLTAEKTNAPKGGARQLGREFNFLEAGLRKLSSLGGSKDEVFGNFISTNVSQGFDHKQHHPQQKGRHSLTMAQHATTRLDTAISLYMPPSVSVAYDVNYADKEIGLMAETGMKVINRLLQMKEITGASVLGAAKDIGTTAGQAALQGGKIAGIKALDVAAPGAETMIALHRGAVITPRMEMMLEGVGRRSFSFTFSFIPKSVQEAAVVKDIIYSFKFHMHPEYSNNSLAGIGKQLHGRAAEMSPGITQGIGREMSIPSTFDIQYMYQNGPNNFLNKISTCFLTKMDVQYGGDRFKAYEPIGPQGSAGPGAAPQKSQITLNFTELEIITKEAIIEGF